MSPSALPQLELQALWILFARIGSAFLLLPGFAEAYVTARLRLSLALLTSLLLAGSGLVQLPPIPDEPASFAALVLSEIGIGLAIGASARLALAAVHLAGSLIATNSGLAGAALFDPSEAAPGTLPGAFLSTTFLVLVFATDAHHALVRLLAASFEGLPIGSVVWVGGLGELCARLGGAMFATGLAMAAPLLAVSLLANLALGLLARLVPSLQVLFVALPLQLLLTLATLALSLGASLLLALRFLEQSTAWLVG